MCAGVPGMCAGVPGMCGGVPGVCAGVPGMCAGVPGMCGGVPGMCGGVPGICAGVPGVCAGVPGCLNVVLYFYCYHSNHQMGLPHSPHPPSTYLHSPPYQPEQSPWPMGLLSCHW